MTFFEFYNIPVSFQIDAAALRATFYANSKKYHPDFFTLASEEEQQRVLDMSTLNNEAYKTLSDFDKRMKYILELKGLVAEEGKNEIPQDFLMEMMDINEELMELEFGFEAAKLEKVEKDLAQLESQLLNELNPLLEAYDDERAKEADLKLVKDYYFKKRYLLRIRENLDKFAGL